MERRNPEILIVFHGLALTYGVLTGLRWHEGYFQVSNLFALQWRMMYLTSLSIHTLIDIWYIYICLSTSSYVMVLFASNEMSWLYPCIKGTLHVSCPLFFFFFWYIHFPSHLLQTLLVVFGSTEPIDETIRACRVWCTRDDGRPHQS